MSTIEVGRVHCGSHISTAGAPPSRPHIVRRTSSYACVGPSGSAAQRAGITLGIVIGSGLLAASSGIHLELWSIGYRTIPTIGPLFLVQVIAGVLLAVLLLFSRRLLMVVAAAGFMVATIAGLLLTIYVGLFGFRDSLAAPHAGLSLGVESAGVAVLAVVGTLLIRGHRVQKGVCTRVETNVNGLSTPGAVEEGLSSDPHLERSAELVSELRPCGQDRSN